MYYNHLVGALEAVLFTAGEPISVAEIAELLQIEKPQVWDLITTLTKEYEAENRGLMVREIAGGYQLVTKPMHYNLLAQMETNKEVKLTNAGMETLAIVAFKQPVTRAEMEAIRGVKVDGVINTLLELGLIAEAGRKKDRGRPKAEVAVSRRWRQGRGLGVLEAWRRSGCQGARWHWCLSW